MDKKTIIIIVVIVGFFSLMLFINIRQATKEIDAPATENSEKIIEEDAAANQD